MVIIDKFICDAEAIICGEAYDVKLISGPDQYGLYVVDVPFEQGSFIERLAVYKSNIFPLRETVEERLLSN